MEETPHQPPKAVDEQPLLPPGKPFGPRPNYLLMFMFSVVWLLVGLGSLVNVPRATTRQEAAFSIGFAVMSGLFIVVPGSFARGRDVLALEYGYQKRAATTMETLASRTITKNESQDDV